MMKRTIITGLTALMLAAPLAAFAFSMADIQAQLDALRATLAALASPASISMSTDASVSHPRICDSLPVRTLYIGVRGDDVAGLQEFLQSEGTFSGSATGYFGPLTSKALARWQVSQGVSGVGVAGPMTRERIRVRCGNPSPTPTCKPINYMPVLCSDGSAPQSTHDSNGCISGYECPVANFTPPANCKAWFDGCNTCSRTSPDSPAMCTMRACFAAGKGYCSAYFSNPVNNQAPSISSFSGPTTLAVNASGTWKIQASDPENQALSYHVTWGDESSATPYASASIASDVFVQTTTFTHAYSAAGTYTVTIVVRDAGGKEAKASSTVKIGSSQTICTMQYDPVCGQPPEPACRHSTPACMIATPGPQTYSNRCTLDAAGATSLYQGQCRTTSVACTADSMQCPNGTWVGRSGANCEFVCPAM